KEYLRLASRPPQGRIKRPRIFYGWWILGLSTAAGFFGGATSQAFFGIFLKPIEDEMGWSRSGIAGVVTVATLLGGVMSPFVGRLADRSGPRALMTFGALLYGLGFMGMALVTQVWHLYLAYFAARIAAVQFMGGVVPRTAVVNWFRRMRGRAMGFQTTAMPLGGALLAILAGILLASGMNWRSVFLLMGATAVALLVLPLAFVLRRRPEDIGLLPDGDIAPQEDAPEAEGGGKPRQIPAEEVSWTLRQAARTPALWLITLGLLLTSWGSGGVSFHMAAYYQGIGMGAGVAAAAVSGFLLAGAFSASLWGFLSERFSERNMFVAATVVAAALMLYAHSISGPIGGIFFAVVLGATTRGEASLLMLLLAKYYGRGSFGTISGLVSQFNFFGLGAGPLVFSLMYDLSGNYSGVFWTATVMFIVAAAALWLARPPATLRDTPAA
ncbi:MAG: MFS transporter, partial [Dehalococcoidia bacterium]